MNNSENSEERTNDGSETETCYEAPQLSNSSLRSSQYVTILLGFNDPTGHPVAGMMYRPLTEPCYWAGGAASEDCKLGLLDMAETPHPKGMLVTDGKVSPFLSQLIDELGYERINSVASGNRAMMLLEGKGGAYIRDTGGEKRRGCEERL